MLLHPFGLSSRTANALGAHAIRVLGKTQRRWEPLTLADFVEVAAQDDDELLKGRNIGRVALAEIRAKVPSRIDVPSTDTPERPKGLGVTDVVATLQRIATALESRNEADAGLAMLTAALDPSVDPGTSEHAQGPTRTVEGVKRYDLGNGHWLIQRMDDASPLGFWLSLDMPGGSRFAVTLEG